MARRAEWKYEFCAFARMGADLDELVDAQRAGFAQDFAANGDLADVVVERTEMQRRDALCLPAEPGYHGLGEGRDPRSMALRLVALLERPGDGRQHARSGFRMRATIPLRAVSPAGAWRSGAQPPRRRRAPRRRRPHT